jgi:hypothetical protein
MGNSERDCWIDMVMADNLNENVRFVRIIAINGLGQWIFADEVFDMRGSMFYYFELIGIITTST